MELYAIYLRKSRMDLEAEAHGEGETLKRHETALLALARQRRYAIGEIYREVVSGETISGRPEMQRLLADVETGRWKGVLVMEESRLARGDTMDQGRVQQAFYYSHTLIITPNKTFNPDEEADQEYFEFGLFMSRREYKMINRRLQRGRLASVKEGKWVGSCTPYGYRKVKLPHEKGSTLEIVPEEARVVRQIFDWYLHDVPIYRIGRRLCEAGLVTAKGQMWNTQGIRQILDNPAYCGMIHYGYRKVDARPQNGIIVKHHYRAEDVEGVNLFRGRHSPIIDDETFAAAKAKRSLRRGIPGPNKESKLKNPFAGLIYCAQCGRAIQRNPGKPGSSDRMLCFYPGCNTGSALIKDLEKLMLNSLQNHLEELTIPEQESKTNDTERAFLRDSIESLAQQLKKTGTQKANAFDLVEQGIYTPDIFSARMQALTAREEELNQRMEELQSKLDELEHASNREQELIPRIRNIIELYPTLESAEEKNNLLKTAISSMMYARKKHASKDGIVLKIYYLF